jgi:phosphonate transport system ATP-binding protein
VFDAAPQELDDKQIKLIYQQSDNPKQKDKYTADTQSKFSYQPLPPKTATQLQNNWR